MFEEKREEKPLGEDDWKDLLEAIHERECVLMLGPDLSYAETDGKRGKPLMKQLIKTINEKLRNKLHDPTLAEVTECYKTECTDDGLDDRRPWKEVKRFINEYKNETNKSFELLAELPFDTVISCAFDDMMENGFKNNNRPPIESYYNYQGVNQRLVKEGCLEKPLVYQLFGNINDAGSLVLTEADMMEFLVNLCSDKKLPENLQSKIQGKYTRLLFLGFNFKHWFLKILLYILQHNTKNRPHEKVKSFAFDQICGGFAKCIRCEDVQSIAMYYKKRSLKVEIFSEDPVEFIEKLHSEYFGQYDFPQTQENNDVPTQTDDLSPMVFISYASEDHERSREVKEQFNLEGINTWRDKEELEAGDDWNKEIIDAINKKVHYVVILETKNLLKKTDSYVNREISTALEKKKDILSYKFLFSLSYENASLDELSDVHRMSGDDRGIKKPYRR